MVTRAANVGLPAPGSWRLPYDRCPIRYVLVRLVRYFLFFLYIFLLTLRPSSLAISSRTELSASAEYESGSTCLPSMFWHSSCLLSPTTSARRSWGCAEEMWRCAETQIFVSRSSKPPKAVEVRTDVRTTRILTPLQGQPAFLCSGCFCVVRRASLLRGCVQLVFDVAVGLLLLLVQ